MNLSPVSKASSIPQAHPEYEYILCKYETEMRNHIKIQQQLKLYIEGQQDKIDEANCLVKEKERNMQTNDKKIQDLI